MYLFLIFGIKQLERNLIHNYNYRTEYQCKILAKKKVDGRWKVEQWERI